MFNKNIVKKYDIRGTFGRDFDLSGVRKIGSFLGSFFKEKQVGPVLVGRDTRPDSEQISQALIDSLLPLGVHVVDVGVCTTPMISFLLHTKPEYLSAIMVTASHNPWQDNGFKVFHDKKKLWGHDLEKVFEDSGLDHPVSGGVPGHLAKKDFTEDYVNYFVESFAHLRGKKFSLILDAMHGSAGRVLKSLVDRLDLKGVSFARTELPSSYDFLDPDTTQKTSAEPALQWLRDSKKSTAFLFDGDGDRFGLVDAKEGLILGDKILSHFMMCEEPGFGKVKKVVSEVKASHLLEEVGKKLNIDVIRCPVGAAFVQKIMQDSGAFLGGEISGHFFFNDRHFGFDDGIYAAMRYLEVLDKGVSLSSCLDLGLPAFVTSDIKLLFFETTDAMESLLFKMKNHFKLSEHKVSEMDGIKVFLEGRGWFLVRKSNTRPCLTVRYEGFSDKLFQDVESILSGWVL